MKKFDNYYNKDKILFGIVSYDKITTKWGDKDSDHNKLGLRVSRSENSFRYNPSNETLGWWDMENIPSDEIENVHVKIEDMGYTITREGDMISPNFWSSTHK